MSFETETVAVARRLRSGHVRAMTPVTLSFIAGMIVYVVASLHWLVPPPNPGAKTAVEQALTYFQFIGFFKIVGMCVAVILINTLFFEIWVWREVKKVARIVAWDRDPETLSEPEAVNSLIGLIDFPHRFTLRFITQWILAAPVLGLGFWLLFSFPFGTLVYLMIGIVALMCLMGVFHFFVVKASYNPHLKEALHQYPTFFKKAELAKRRISYRRKIMIYLMVFAGAITWITTHLSLVGQEYSECYQRDRYIGQRMSNLGEYLEKSLIDNAGYSAFDFYGKSFQVEENETVYLLDGEGKDLMANPAKDAEGNEAGFEKMPLLDYQLMSFLSQAPRVPAAAVAADDPAKLKPNRFFFSALAVKITPRVSIIYWAGSKFIVSLDAIGGRWFLVTIKPFRMDNIQYVFQMGPVWLMFGIALGLSFLLARFIQYEVMGTLSRIIDSSDRIENGDLSEPDPMMADDEFGELAVHHLKMVDSVRSMVGQVSAGAAQTDYATSQLSVLTDEMARGSEAQSLAVEETSAIIAQMNQTIGNIAESVDTMASSAEQSSAAIIEMSANNDQVAKNAEGLTEIVVETTSSIQQMSASIREVAENVRNTSDKTSEVASSMRELREAVKEVDSISEKSAEISRQVMNDAETGAAAVQSTIKGINQIWEASREAASVIEGLSKRVREIGRILTVIEDVTEETNLLALNAAIIAAQEGEHGRGFAVVADEIKELAERTQVSTSEIAEQIQAVQREAANAVTSMEKGEESVSKGVFLSEEAGEALRKIQESAERSHSMSTNISQSTREQSRQTDQILQFTESIAAMIGQINTASQEQAKGSDQILLAAEKMRDIAVQVRKATKEQATGSRQISQAIEHVTNISGYINTSQNEQKKAAQQVLAAITQIADIAHQNVKGVEAAVESVSNLKVLSEEFKNMIDAYTAKIGQNGEEED